MFGIFKKAKEKSDAINTYCFDAAKCHLFLEDENAIIAVIAALIVMGNQQRYSMIKALENYSEGLSKEAKNIFATKDHADRFLEKSAELASAIELVKSKNWGLVDIANAKSHLSSEEKLAEKALTESDGDYFKRKHNFHTLLVDQ